MADRPIAKCLIIASRQIIITLSEYGIGGAEKRKESRNNDEDPRSTNGPAIRGGWG